MDFWNELTNQLKNLWQQSTVSGRATFVGTAVVCVAIILGVGYWSSLPEYVPFASNLPSAELTEIVGKLTADGIEYELSGAGTGVTVRKSQFGRARMAVGDTTGPLASAPVDLENSMWLDPLQKKIRELRRLEQSLAHSIMQISSVEWARVHISQPESTPFARDARHPKASVVLKLRSVSNAISDPSAAVVSILVGGIEGLGSSNVQIAESNGRLLFDGSPEHGNLSGRLEYRRNIEIGLASNAQSMLAKALGYGKALVTVTADIDYTKTSRSATEYDSENTAKNYEMIDNSTNPVLKPPVAGPAGFTPNSTGGDPSSNGFAMGKKEILEAKWEVPTTVDRMEKSGGTVQRLTVAAIVDVSVANDALSENETPMTQDEVERIIKAAVGFDDSRNDDVQVVMTRLQGISTDAELEAPPMWDKYNQLARSSSLGIAAFVALILGFVYLRKLRPLTVPGESKGESKASRSSAFSDLASQAKQNPEAVSAIISAWLGTPATQPAAADIDTVNPAIQRVRRAAA